MKKFPKILFLVLVFFICFASVLTFDFKGEVSAVEKRKLAEFPEMNLAFFKNLDSYFQDRFGGRNALISLANFLDYKVFHKAKHNSKVVEGKNGWFYYANVHDGNNLSDFMKTNLMDENKIREFSAKVKDIVDFCDSNGIKYLFVINPNKHNVYPEYYPLERPAGPSRYDQYISLFREMGVNCVFTRDMLIEEKKSAKVPLYYETDSHWNRFGAYYAYREIRGEVENLFQNTVFPSFECDFKVSYRYDYNDSPEDHYGDLLPFLGLSDEKCTYLEVSPAAASFSDYYDYVKNEDTAGIITKGKNPLLPKALVYRDSFCRNLQPYLSTMFSETEYVWKKIYEFDKAQALESKPDIIIFEALERMLI